MRPLYRESQIFFNLPSVLNPSTIEIEKEALLVKDTVYHCMSRMNQHFVFWYYQVGLRGLFTCLRDWLRFIAHRFSIGGLLGTLVAPWKRDMASQTWRGLHPLLFLRMLFDNFLSRFLGALVRSSVIVIGVTVLGVASLIGAAILLGYVFAPIFLLIGVTQLDTPLGRLALALGTVGGIGSLVLYSMREQEDLFTTDIRVLRKKKYFERILGRLGLKPGSFARETIEDPARFLAFLETRGIDREIFVRAIRQEQAAWQRRRERQRFWRWENLRKIQPIGKGWQFGYTAHLDRYCYDISRDDKTEYGQADLIGRAEEFQVATLVLMRPTQNSVILVGEPGIGRKTFIHYLARLIRENTFERQGLAEARVLLFDLGRAASDAVARGEEAEHFVRGLMAEAVYAGNVILVIEDIDQYLGPHQTRSDLAPLFSEFLGLANFRLLAIASTAHYHALARVEEDVLKFFDVIYLREPTAEETLEILVRHFEPLEKKRILFTRPALEAVVSQAARYNWETAFPERALDLAQEVILYWQGTGEDFITPETIENFITLKTGMPAGAIREEEREKLLHLEERIHRRVIGQTEAIRQVAEAMRKARAGFSDAKRPLGSFIFFGPSGVGKTETAKAFAESYFGHEDKMIRLDMSEFQTSESIDRLIGSQERNIPGMLVAAAREHPFAILLLDEIEKAYPRALDLFLQILDEGYVTDGFGEKVSFRHMVIIATSNAGAALIKTLVREHAPLTAIRKQVLDHIVEQNLFRLEFLGRFDGIIFFEPLRPPELEAVAALKLEQFANRLKQEKNISVAFANDVVSTVVAQGFEPEFGMRSLNRFIEDTIEDIVVKKIIAGDLVPGGSLTIAARDL